MQERVPDRSAAHAPAHLLEVRDWLLVALAFSAGAYEAICFLSFGKVFTGVQTGNLLFLGFIAAGTRPPVGPHPVTVVVSMLAFAAGAAAAMPILGSSSGDRDVKDNEIIRVWPQHTSFALGVALALQIGFLTVWMAEMTGPPSADVSYILIGLIAFAMGMQMNAIRLLHVPGISTTAATATYIGLVSGLVTRSLKAREVARLAAVLVCMAGGALLGDWMLSHAHSYAPLPSVLVSAMVIVIASAALNQRSDPPRLAGRLACVP
jgi:uncharacterized membrane protein YoaK (UPF0700 family)